MKPNIEALAILNKIFESRDGRPVDSATITRQDFKRLFELLTGEYVYPAWIPCSERMPPANQDVLFWEPRGMGYGYKDVDDPDSRRWIDKLSSDRDGDYCDTFEVTHWMPLPSGPISSPEGKT